MKKLLFVLILLALAGVGVAANQFIRSMFQIDTAEADRLMNRALELDSTLAATQDSIRDLMVQRQASSDSIRAYQDSMRVISGRLAAERNNARTARDSLMQITDSIVLNMDAPEIQEHIDGIVKTYEDELQTVYLENDLLKRENSLLLDRIAIDSLTIVRMEERSVIQQQACDDFREAAERYKKELGKTTRLMQVAGTLAIVAIAGPKIVDWIGGDGGSDSHDY